MSTPKQAARASLVAEWQEHTAYHPYPHQVSIGNTVYDHFMRGALVCMLITSPQGGKTGASVQTIMRMCTDPDDQRMIHPDNVYILTGMSDADWVHQMRSRVPPRFKGHIYHRPTIPVVEALASVRDCLVVIDECHYASGKTQTLHTRLAEAGFLDVNFLKDRNVRLLFISATPVDVLIDAQQWGSSLFAKIVDRGMDAYVGFHTLLAESRVKSSITIVDPDTAAKFVIDATIHFQSPMYHILRLIERTRAKSDIAFVIKECGYDVVVHDSAQPNKRIDRLLATRPTKHQFVLIKGFWRASKTLNDAYIGAVYDMTADGTAAAQGLGGRLLGYGKRRGPQAPLLYANQAVLKEYVSWLDTGCDYSKVRRLTTATLKIHHGAVLDMRSSFADPKGVANLVVEKRIAAACAARDAASATVPKPKKLRVVKKVPGGAHLATTFERCSVVDFCARFQLAHMPASAMSLSAELRRNGVRVNASYKMTAATSVCNLANYYSHPEWADATFHIIYEEGDGELILITRDTQALKNVTVGASMVAHNAKGQLVLYEFV